jgi:predicted transcriptional regulator
MFGFLGPNVPSDPSRSEAIIIGNLKSAHENTQRLLAVFQSVLSAQPIGIQRDVIEEIHRIK